jgi:hypothetical protein
MHKKKDYALYDTISPPIYLFSEFSDFQKHRHSFVPGCPLSLSDPDNQKVKLLRKDFPADDCFKQLFPTLLSKDMPFLELSIN